MISSWAIVAIVAILVWGVIKFAKASNGVITDEHGNEKLAPRDDGRHLAEIEAAQREVIELKERIKVLERIVTDSNTGDAREQARITAEIEALRGLPAARKEEQSE
ncbi:MAG TPA: hypothetical protein VK913_12305 [Erythrobacter sp.]|nr:hypothetical protein [Erythrobacter sp.]